MSWKWIAGLSAVTAGLLYVLYEGFGRDPHEVPFLLEGKPAPEFTLTRVEDGKPFTSAEARGRPLVVNFWSTWCEPCKYETPVLQWAGRELASEAQFIGVVFEDTEDSTRRFLAENPSTFPQLYDPNSRMSVDYGVAGVPETYFIDAKGIIRHKHIGPIDQQTMMHWVRMVKLSPEAAARAEAQR